MLELSLGIILLLSGFAIFLFVGREIPKTTGVILFIFLGILILMSYFQKMPTAATACIFGCFFGTIIGQFVPGMLKTTQQ